MTRGDPDSAPKGQIPRGLSWVSRRDSYGQAAAGGRKSRQTSIEDRKEDRNILYESWPSVAALGPW